MAKRRKYLDNGPDGDPVVLPVDKNGIPVANLNEVEISSNKLPLKYSDENVNRYAQAVASGQIKLTQIPDQKLRNAVRAQPILNQWTEHMNKNAGTAAMLSVGIPATVIGAIAGAPYLKGAMDVLGSPASSVAKELIKRGIISEGGNASYIANGADILYNTVLSGQGIGNLISDNGVQKTVRKIKEGDTVGALKSGAIDALDLLGGISLVGNTRNLLNHRKFLSGIKLPRRTKRVANNTQIPEEVPVRHLDSPEVTSQRNNIPVSEEERAGQVLQQIEQRIQQLQRNGISDEEYRLLHNETTNWWNSLYNWSNENRRGYIGSDEYWTRSREIANNYDSKNNEINAIINENIARRYPRMYDRRMSDEEFTSRIENARDLNRRYLENPEQFVVGNPPRRQQTVSRTEERVPSRNNTNELGSDEVIQSTQHAGTSVSEQQQPQRVVHTLENLEENVENRGTLENLLKAKQEHSEAIDRYNLWFDDQSRNFDERLNYHRDVRAKEKDLQTIGEDYVYNLTKNIDFSKPLESQINFDEIPHFVLGDVIDKLKSKLEIQSLNLSDSQYWSTFNNLSDIIESHRFDPFGYMYKGSRNHPNLTSGETIGNIRDKMRFYLEEANNPRYFGQHTEKFDEQFSLQSKPMITGALTELSKTRRKNAQLPVRVSWTGKGRTGGNHYADLIVDGVRVTGSAAANGPTELNTVLRQNIKRELDFYEEFGDQLGIPKEKIEELKKAFKDGTMSPEDFGKIKTKDGHYMFTIFDKEAKAGRYPSIRADFRNGGSIHRSLKNNGRRL